MSDIKKEFALYLKSNICKPSDWEVLGLGDFPPRFTSTKKYCEHLVMQKTDSIKLSAIYSFFDYEEDRGSFSDWIASSNKTKAIENFFKKKDYVPVKSTLDFVGILFNSPLPTISDFQNSLKGKKEIEVEEKLIVEQSVNQSIGKKKVNYWLAAVGVVFVIISAVYLYSYTNMKKQVNAQASIIGNLAFEPKEVNELNIVSAVSNDDEHIASNSNSELTYYTNRIYNSDFIIPKDKWGFDIDSKGEDINSEYGLPFSKELKPLYKETLGNKTSIANNQMLIRLNIKNNSDAKWVIDNIYLKKIDQYTPNVVNVLKNTWSVKEGELSYKFELNKYASIYPITTFIELEPGEAKYFAMNITGDHSCNGAIFKYKLVFSGNGSSGNNITIESDKNYYLGFYTK